MSSTQEVLDALRAVHIEQCPLSTFLRDSKAIQNAIDLIEQQAARIERLRSKLEAVETARNVLSDALKVATESPWTRVQVLTENGPEYVSDNMPPAGKPVLVEIESRSGKSYEVFTYDDRRGYRSWLSFGMRWMPIPEATDA